MRWLRGWCHWGLCPQTPGIYRVPARIAVLLRNWGLRPQTPGALREGDGGPVSLLFRPLSRRSGCVPAEPYPPLRFFQGGRLQPRRATIVQRTAITPLTSCRTPRVHFNTTGKYTVLHSFSTDSNSPKYPDAGLARDSAGNLYGTTQRGGAAGAGVVYKLGTAGN